MKKRQKQKAPLIIRQAEKAMQIAVSKVVKEHRRRGAPLVVWRKGKVVKVAA